MTVAATNSFDAGTGNGAATVFPFSFRAQDKANVDVYVNGVLTTFGFTIALNSSGVGGTVTFDTAPAVGAKVVIASSPPMTQTAQFADSGPYLGSAHDAAYDAGAIRDVFLYGETRRSIRAPVGEQLEDLPSAASRAGKYLTFDALGNPVPSVGVGADGSLRTDLALGTGASLLGTVRAEGGAVQRSVRDMLRQFVFAEDFGATGDGVADDTTELQAALNTGKRVILQDGKSYMISSGLNHVSGSGFVCFGWARIVAKTGVGGFNIKDVGGASRFNLNRNMLLCNQTDDLAIHNVEFTTDGASPAVIHGIRIYGGMATRGYDIRAAFSNFAVGCMIALGSVGRGQRSNIDITSARNSGTSQGNTYWTGGSPQTTVVEIDNDTLLNTPSKAGTIRIGLIENILFTGQALVDYGCETDGVNIIGQAAAFTTSGWDIAIGVIDGIGEGVDIFALGNTIRIGSIKNAYNYPVKLIHGAQRNYIDVGTVENSGKAAVTICGSATADRDTTLNDIRIGTVKNPGAYGLGPAASDAAVVLFIGANFTFKPTKNFVRVDTIIADANLDCAVVDGGAGANNENIVEIGKATGVTKSVSAPSNNVRVKYLGRCYAEMTMSVGQAIPSATATQLAFNTTATDTEGVAVPASNKFTALWPGLYLVRAQVLMSNWRVGTDDQVTLELRKNTTIKSRIKDRIHFTAKDQVVTIAKEIMVLESEIGTVEADINAWLTQDTGASKTTGTTAYQTLFAIERVG